MAETIRIEIPIETIDKTDNIDNVIQKLERLEKVAVKASNQVKNSGKSISSSFGNASNQVSQFDKTAEKTQRSLASWMKEKYQLLIEAKDNATPVIQKIKSTLGGAAGRAWKFTVGVVDRATRPFRSIFSGLNSVLGMFGLGMSFAGGIVMPLKLVMQQQGVETAFEVLLGSASKAKQRVEELTTFAGSTPYTRDEVYEASRVLQVFTGNALSTGKGLKMVGDIASGTKQEFGDVALWVGRLYDAMKSGRPVGEMTSRLQEMGAIDGKARERLEKLAASGKKISETWPAATKEFSRFDGMMEKMSGNLSNLLLGVKSFVTNNVMKPLGKGWAAALTPVLQKFRQWRKENPELIAQMAASIEKNVAGFADAVVNKVTAMINKVSALMNTSEFQNADFFGKVKIAWDDLIATPFGEWWDSKGQAMVAEKAGAIGRGIGTAVSTGLLALLGVDVSGIVGEGASVGASFAKGLIDGFDIDALQAKLWSAIKGIFANAGKILPGGQSADLSSWLSAGLIAKVAGPLLKGGFNMAKLGKTLFGGSSAAGGAAAAGGASGIGGLLGSASTASGSLVGGGLIGGAAKLGSALGSGAYTGAGLAAAGAGAAVGGIAAGATLISGGKDLYKGFKSKDKKEADAYKGSGALKVGGVAAGAAIGTMILPGVGTLVGAGIGGIAGWLAGNKVKKDYAESVKKAKEEAEKLKLAEAQATYESQEMKDALADSSMTAEEFGQKFEKAVGTNLKSHFGNVQLSMDEIKSTAEKLVFGKTTRSVERFTEATQTAAQSMSTLKSTMSGLDKLGWKGSLGMKLSKSDIKSYKAGIDELMKNATQYLEDKHYEAKVAIDLLVGSDGSSEITSGLDSTYESLQKQLNGLGKNLKAKVKVALKDGVITIDEQKEIANLQKKIAEITAKVSQAQSEAGMEKLKIKYGGSNLSTDSFKSLQSELQTQMQGATQSYDQALEVGITSLKLQLSEGAINQEQYDDQLQTLTSGYEANIKDMNVRVESFQLDTIAEAYGSELDGILPDLAGTTSEKLGAALHNAMANGVDVTTWDAGTAAQWLGLESLSTESQAAIAEMMSGVAQTIPESVQSEFANALSSIDMSSIDLAGPISNELYNQIALIDLSEAASGVGSGIGNAISATDMGPINSAIDTLKSSTGTAINSAFAPGFSTSTPVTITADYKLANPSATINFSGGGSGTATVTASIAKNAEGSIVNGPLLSWVGEDGPEAIIPLGGKRRARGLSLWERAGELLGVKKYADGGVVSGNATNSLPNVEDLTYISKAVSSAPRGGQEPSALYEESDTPTYVVGASESAASVSTGEAGGINIEINLNPSFDIDGSQAADEDSIVTVLKSHIREMADELGDELAERLQKVFSNMPAKEV